MKPHREVSRLAMNPVTPRQLFHSEAIAPAAFIASGCQDFPNAFQRVRHRLPSHRFTVAAEVEYLCPRVTASAFPCDPYRADRLVHCAAGWTGDAGDGHCDCRTKTRQRTRDH